MIAVEFIETSVYKRDADDILTPDEQRELQNILIADPEAGDRIEGTGGLRKLRFGAKSKGKGKRGGVRSIYYHHRGRHSILLLLIYPKNRKDDLTPDQKKALKALVEREFK